MDIHFVWIFLSGIFAGFINTLAGSGSFLTIPILMFSGLNAGIANATNRIGILTQTLTSTIAYGRKTDLNIKENLKFIVISFVGAIIGSNVALDIPDFSLKIIILCLTVFMLVIVFLNKNTWAGKSEKPKASKILTPVLFLVAGFYGGFIQAGVGILYLVCFLSLLCYPINKANGLKNLVVLIYTIPVVINFMIHDQINWPMGISLALGQVIGSWIGSRFAFNVPNAQVWTRRLLMGALLIVVIKLVLDFQPF